MTITITDWTPATSPPKTAEIVLVSARYWHDETLGNYVTHACYSNGRWLHEGTQTIMLTVYAWAPFPEFEPAPYKEIVK